MHVVPARFAGNLRRAGLAHMPRPRRRTKAGALAAGHRVARGRSLFKNEAFKGVDVFSRLLPYHDKTRHSIYDHSHEFANCIKNVFAVIGNEGAGKKKRFTAAVRAYETEQLGRFQGLRSIPGVRTPSPPWCASASSKEVTN